MYKGFCTDSAGRTCKTDTVIKPIQLLADLRADKVLESKSGGSSWVGTLYDSGYTEEQKYKITHDCGDTVKILVSDGAGGYTDMSDIKFDEKNIGDVVDVEIRVVDENNNFVQCKVIYKVVDTKAPVISEVPDTVIYYKKGECSATFTETYEQITELLNIVDCTNTTLYYKTTGAKRKLDSDGTVTIPDKTVKDEIEIEWFVKDSYDNEVSTKQKVIVKDTIKPTVDCSLVKDYTIVLRETNSLPVIDSFKVMAGFKKDIVQTDICDGEIHPSKFEKLEDDVYSRFEYETYVYPFDDTTYVRVHYTDKNGNDTFCTQKLIVVDSVPAKIKCPADITDPLACYDETVLPSMTVTYDEFIAMGGSVTDERNLTNKSITVDSTFVGDSCQSLTTFIYSITDRFNNVSTCTNKFEVKDSIAPLCFWSDTNLKTDTVVSCDKDMPDLPSVYAVDNCQKSDIIVKYDVVSTQGTDSSQCNFYTYKVEYTFYAEDRCGNMTKEEDRLRYTVNIVDTIPPVFEMDKNFVSDDYHVPFEKPCKAYMPDFLRYVSDTVDVCSGSMYLTLSQLPVAGEELTGDTTLTITLTDVCNNKTEFKKKIFVQQPLEIASVKAYDYTSCVDDVAIDLKHFDIVSMSGVQWARDRYTGKITKRKSAFVYTIYKDKYDDDHILLSTDSLIYKNMKVYQDGEANGITPVKVTDLLAALDSVTKSGKYYFFAKDTATHCTAIDSSIITINDRPRVAMSADSVEACENQALPIHGSEGEYTDIYGVCVDGMGLPILDEGWMLGGKPYNAEPITHEYDHSLLSYYATNACGTTTSDSSKVWDCSYSFDIADGSFVADGLTNEQFNTDTSSSSLGLKIHERILPENIMLTTDPQDKARIYSGDSVTLTLITPYTDRTEFHWYRVVDQFDAIDNQFDGHGNLLESFVNVYDAQDELLAVTKKSQEGGNKLMVKDIQDTTAFYVVVTDKVCSSSASNLVSVDANMIIPTAITPHNSQGYNDVFMKRFPVVIFNRYGNKVFEGNDGWDGTIRGQLADPAVYFYQVTLRNGEVRKGSVEVVYFK